MRIKFELSFSQCTSLLVHTDGICFLPIPTARCCLSTLRFAVECSLHSHVLKAYLCKIKMLWNPRRWPWAVSARPYCWLSAFTRASCHSFAQPGGCHPTDIAEPPKEPVLWDGLWSKPLESSRVPLGLHAYCSLSDYWWIWANGSHLKRSLCLSTQRWCLFVVPCDSQSWKGSWWLPVVPPYFTNEEIEAQSS